jgi:uncharacterized YigZ family protein
MEEYSYKTIGAPSEGNYKDKGSRFLSFAYPAGSPDEIKPLLEALRKEYHDARHHCYAYMTGYDRSVWRVNDDGEPSGTAGRPILGQINSAGLTNILVVVVRYFGGTLLGVSGLINAYRSAALDAINNSTIVERTLRDYYEIHFPSAVLNEVMRIVKKENAGQSQQSFGSGCSMVIDFVIPSRDKILNQLNRIKGLESRFIGTR